MLAGAAEQRPRAAPPNHRIVVIHNSQIEGPRRVHLRQAWSMRSWSDAEHLVRREAARLVVPGNARPRRLIAAVGSRLPTAVITSRAPGPEGTRRALAELVVLAAAFAPERAIVATAEPLRPGRGMVIAHDLQVVADGCVEMTREWMWRRVLGRIVWVPAEVRDWRAPGTVSSDLARLMVAEGLAATAPERLRELLDHCLAVGHRVRLAATSPVAG